MPSVLRVQLSQTLQRQLGRQYKGGMQRILFIVCTAYWRGHSEAAHENAQRYLTTSLVTVAY
jgi:hypothetical protein